MFLIKHVTSENGSFQGGFVGHLNKQAKLKAAVFNFQAGKIFSRLHVSNWP